MMNNSALLEMENLWILSTGITFGVVLNNHPRDGCWWCLRATPARAHHLRGVFDGVDASMTIFRAMPAQP